MNLKNLFSHCLSAVFLSINTTLFVHKQILIHLRHWNQNKQKAPPAFIATPAYYISLDFPTPSPPFVRNLRLNKQQRHQNAVIEVVVVSSSPTLNTSHTSPQCLHFRLREGKRPLGHIHGAILGKYTKSKTRRGVLRTQALKEIYSILVIYHKRKIVGSLQIKIIIFIVKTIILFLDLSQTNDRVLNPPLFFLNI